MINSIPKDDNGLIINKDINKNKKVSAMVGGENDDIWKSQKRKVGEKALFFFYQRPVEQNQGV